MAHKSTSWMKLGSCSIKFRRRSKLQIKHERKENERSHHNSQDKTLFFPLINRINFPIQKNINIWFAAISLVV